MLATETRKLYTECLAAPPGYRFDAGIATSFTLSLETLLVLPFSLAGLGSQEPSALFNDQTALLESLQETAERLFVFCHDGYIQVPPREQLLFGLLDRCVVPARPPVAPGLFHPKLWLLRFRNDEDETLLRAVVLSRNLTFDRSWDTVLCLDGVPTGRTARSSRGLADLVRALPRLSTQPLSDARSAVIESLADDASRTRFDAPPPFFGEPIFHAIGIEDAGRRGKTTFSPTPEGYGRRLLCVSPFLSPETIRGAADLVDEECLLVSRPEHLAQMPPEVLGDWDVRVLADAADEGDTADEGVDDTESATERRPPPRGLHAKIVAIEDHQRRVTWWVGSANLTRAGWTGLNVELMVELGGGRNTAGIDAFLNSGFADVLEPWAPTPPDDEALEREKALAVVDHTRDVLASAGLRLRCHQEEDRWTLHLEGQAKLDPRVEVAVWPVTVLESTHRRELPTGKIDLAFGPLSPASLTSLVAFEVRSAADHSLNVRFALQLPCSGLPDDRDAHIVRNIVKSRAGFLRYLRLLLALAETSPFDKADLLRRAQDGNNGQRAVFDEVLLENILRALSREPLRLQAVDRLVRDMSKTEEGREAIPAEFLDLWQVVRGALPAEGVA